MLNHAIKKNQAMRAFGNSEKRIKCRFVSAQYVDGSRMSLPFPYICLRLLHKSQPLLHMSQAFLHKDKNGGQKWGQASSGKFRSIPVHVQSFLTGSLQDYHIRISKSRLSEIPKCIKRFCKPRRSRRTRRK